MGLATASQTLTGASEAGAKIGVFDGATQLGVATANSSGQWSYALGQLSVGTHNLSATATDLAGNVGPASSALAYTVASAPPPSSPTGLSDASIVGGYVNAAHDTASQSLSGSAAAGLTVAVYDGAAKLGSALADGSGAWSFILGHLADGGHSLTAVAVDASGAASAPSSALKFTVDTQIAPPQVNDISLMTWKQAGLTGSAEAGSVVKVYDNGSLAGTTTANASGTWSLADHIGPGVHSTPSRSPIWRVTRPRPWAWRCFPARARSVSSAGRGTTCLSAAVATT